MRLEKKVVVITGASSGLRSGERAAVRVRGCLDRGRRHHGEAARRRFEADLDTPTAELIRQRGGKAVFAKCDVMRKADTDAAVAAAADSFGRLDVMFNNAGIYRGGKLVEDFTDDDLDACFAVNVKGSWHGAQSAIAQFHRQHREDQGRLGNIFNLVSTAGLGGHPKQSVCNISKGAQTNLVRCLAIEYGEQASRESG